MNKKWYTDVLMLNRDPNWYRFADCSDREACRCYFEKYFSITVREKAGKKFLEKLHLKAETVCDPTMLFYHEPELYRSL